MTGGPRVEDSQRHGWSVSHARRAGFGGVVLFGLVLVVVEFLHSLW